MIKHIMLRTIRWYQTYLSLENPYIKAFLGTDSACKYYPTCSEYMYQAIEKHGIIRGSFIGIKRISRCNPWSHGGIDPVR